MSTGKTYSTKYLLDSNNNRGAAGQVLSTTSTGIDWVDANTVPGTGLWLANGNDIYNSNSGNVGIGTTGPGAKLDVEAGSTGDAQGDSTTAAIFRAGRQNVWFQNQRTAAGTDWNNNTFKIIAKIDTTSHQSINFVNDASYNEHIDIYTGNQVFNTRFNANGNVGIGVTNPGQKLDVAGNIKANDGYIRSEDGATGDYIEVFNDGANTGQSFITTSANELILIPQNGGLQVKGENYGTGNDASLQIYNALNAAVKVKLNSNGDSYLNGGEVGINTTSPSATLHLKAIASNGVPFKLEAHPSTSVSQMLIYATKAYNSTDAWYNLVCEAGDGSGGQTNTCIIERDGDLRNKNNSYGQISDSRLKENIIDATPKLDDVMKVKVKNFNFIGEDLKQIGVVAQELEEVFPGLVKEDKQPDVNGEEGGVYKSVKYSVLVPILVKAMQEQQEIIEDLKTRITKLEN